MATISKLWTGVEDMAVAISSKMVNIVMLLVRAVNSSPHKLRATGVRIVRLES